jgi:hypothetical protein
MHQVKAKETEKKELLTERSSAGLEQAVSGHTKTLTNMSNLEEDP